MKTKNTIRGTVSLGILLLLSTTVSASEPRYLNRSIYLPIEFHLCEHLTNAVLYQNDTPVSMMPANRVFQFTYYPDLEKLLPELVKVRIEGQYADGTEPFVAKLAVSPQGVHTAHRTQAADLDLQLKRQRGKVDIRLKEKVIGLRCPRFCKREAAKVAGTDETSRPKSANASDSDSDTSNPSGGKRDSDHQKQQEQQREPQR